VVDAILPKATFLDDSLGWGTRQTIREKTYVDADSQTFDLGSFGLKKCEILDKLLEDQKINPKTINTLKSWIKNIKNPKDAVITSLTMLEKTLTTIIKDSKHKWVLMENNDNMLVPYAVKGVKFHPRSRDSEEFVSMYLGYIAIKSDSSRYSDDPRELKRAKIDKNVYFYKSDLSIVTEEDLNEHFSTDEEDDDTDDEKPKSKKTKGAKKSDSYLLSKILSEKSVLLMDDDYMTTYEEDILKTNKISKSIGSVYTCATKGYIIPEGKSGVASWKLLNQENKTSKLVVDELMSESISYAYKSDYFGDIELPEHPYILTYDLSSFKYAVVHVNNIEPYIYNPQLIDKLVISDAKKRILSALIGSKNNFEDIISGKSGGDVILSTGGAGLGKTLTAEVYSEVMKKPLYCVQSSQLGINVSEIEQNLNRILYRAEKWNAVLLIDEADSYIYKRGNDILQNCIVGTFLRLMEYYNGILFLTSNRPDIIDDAIMSRVTIHIKYELPTLDETLLLWNILSDNFGMTIDEVQIRLIWNEYKPFSGRDIRNTMKDISKCFPDKKKITFSMIKEIEEFLPFIKKLK
jgi:hypothetical protein